MFLEVVIVLWIIFAVFVYVSYYILEVVLDLPVLGQSPCSAHTALKQVVQQFIADAAVLPLLKAAAPEHVSAGLLQTGDRSYEELLSTAIINKVVHNFQYELSKSSRTNSVSSGSIRRRKAQNHLEEIRWQEEDENFSASSSIDEMVLRSSSRASSTKYVDMESLTIKEAPDYNGPYSQAYSISPPHSLTLYNIQTADVKDIETEDTSLEENWYMQKPYKISSSLVTVPILVPNPTTAAEILIDGKPVDRNNSDLSDIDSFDLENGENISSLGSVLVNSKNTIGGKNCLPSLRDEDLGIEQIANVTVGNKLLISVNLEPENNHIIEAVNMNGFTQDIPLESSMLSSDSHTEKDSEFTETYGPLPRKIPARNTSSSLRKEILQLEEVNSVKNVDVGVTSEVDEQSNKDYMETPDKNFINDRFGRDYYIRQASRSSGIKSDRNMFEDISDKLKVEQNVNEGSELVEVQSLTTDLRNSNDSVISEEHQECKDQHPSHLKSVDHSLKGMVSAKVVIIDEEHGTEVDQNCEAGQNCDASSGVPSQLLDSMRPNVMDVSSESDYSMERTYNVMTGKISEKNPQPEEETPQTSAVHSTDDKELIMEEENQAKFHEKINSIKNFTCDVPTVTASDNETNPILSESHRKDFSLEYSSYGDGGEFVDQPEMSDEIVKGQQENKINISHDYVTRNSQIIRQGTIMDDGLESVPSVRDLRKLFDSQAEQDRLSRKVPLFNRKSSKTQRDFEEERDVISYAENFSIEEPVLKSVKNLRKLFDNAGSENQHPVNSITARNINPKLRLQLKDEGNES